ncbi:TPA: hypothetical protein KKX58_003098 [Legionella pneumophila]|nr:hypothetical protein [Legionella pneumophila]HBD7411744.1 hypothetical protein [Legionella pneumophila]HBD9406931.1 hypothetical protein [Legionella pneumophila]HBI2969978.1 hypothetical protein [Legionella pneumophila]
MANHQEYYGEPSGILWRTIRNIMANHQEYYGEPSGISIFIMRLVNLTDGYKTLRMFKRLN